MNRRNKRKILFIEGIYPINTRSDRIINTLNKIYDITITSWDRRKNITKKEDNYRKILIYKSNIGYGKKIRKLLSIFSYYNFIKNKKKEINPDIIIVSQWDMLMLGYLLKKKNEKLIYDNIDMLSCSNFFIEFFLKTIERICLRKCDLMIYASRFFKENYSFFNKKEYIMENFPLKKNFTHKNFSIKPDKKKLKIGFVGTVRYYDILKNIIETVSELDFIEFRIYGIGPDEKKLKRYIEKENFRNIYFLGGYKYENIGDIYNSLDIVWAAYPNKDRNVKFAISNKFFESLVYSIPTFFANKTRLGDYIKEKEIGFVIDPYNCKEFFKTLNYNSLLSMIDRIRLNIDKYKLNKSFFWEDKEDEFLKYLKDNLWD